MIAEKVLWPTILLLDIDPRDVTADWINIDAGIAGITISTYVVPLDKVNQLGKLKFRDIPIITWEDPGNDYDRARQYVRLFQVTKAERLVSLGWRYNILYGQNDMNYMVSVTALLFAGSSATLLSRVIHRKLPRVYPLNMLTYLFYKAH